MRVALLLCLLFVGAVLCDTEVQTPKKAAKGVFVVSLEALAADKALSDTQLPNQLQQQKENSFSLSYLQLSAISATQLL